MLTDWLTQPDGLATRLHDLRTSAGMSGKDLAKALDWQQSKVSRLENGRQMPAENDIEAWASACGAKDETIREMLDQLGEAESVRMQFRRRMSRGQAAVQASYNDLVERSTLVRHFETVYVPGLLQIPEYARRVLTEMVDLHELPIDDVDAAVSGRMQRQQMLYDTSRRFEFLLAEPVLHWRLCPPEVMRHQLDRLHSVLGMSHVRLGVIPLGVELATTPQNSFQLYDDTAIVETFIGETVHGESGSAAYARAMERLWDEAVTGDDVRQLIIAATEDLPRSG
jgi:transcriptional regulator with XRE-family HTH domain